MTSSKADAAARLVSPLRIPRQRRQTLELGHHAIAFIKMLERAATFGQRRKMPWQKPQSLAVDPARLNAAWRAETARISGLVFMAVKRRIYEIQK